MGSDGELAELLPDKTRSVSRQKKKRRVIRRQEEKEYSSDGTDTSDLVVTDKEYYSIRHETEYHIENKTEFIVSENEDETRSLKQNNNQAEEEEKIEEDNDDVDTETSDLEVTNKEYYTISHETEFSEKKEKEFIILFSPKKNVIKMQSCEEASNLADPWKPALD